ncbi:MAG: HNH endonuclease [Jatrophihabitans sp.]
MKLTAVERRKLFAMPNPVTITGRTSSITNSFVNSIIPVVEPTDAEIENALDILGMQDQMCCAYCGDQHTEWDHLRPLVVDKMPTGYISEIHNLVPSCGKCNQSKGNKDWYPWMFGRARLSPASRGITGFAARAERLKAYEAWAEPIKINFEGLVGSDIWNTHWSNHRHLIALMRDAQDVASQIREKVRCTYLEKDPTRP